ncbi:Uncharacterised protein [Vibrio vulnificus]|nr:Uncharacterised protein [Vibrio vulnificus]
MVTIAKHQKVTTQLIIGRFLLFNIKKAPSKGLFHIRDSKH